MDDLYFEGRIIVIKVHAVKRAREREIVFPDQVYNCIKTGKTERFAKHGIKFIKKTKKGLIMCIGEDLGHCIIIKTVERWN